MCDLGIRVGGAHKRSSSAVSLSAFLAGLACGFPGSACWRWGWDKARAWGREVSRGRSGESLEMEVEGKDSFSR